MAVDVLDLLEIAPPPDPDAELAAFLPVAAGPGRAPGAPADVVRGPCAKCVAAAGSRCLRCARHVCSRHYRFMFGLCVDCAPPREPPARAGGPPRGLDVPWIE